MHAQSSKHPSMSSAAPPAGSPGNHRVLCACESLLTAVHVLASRPSTTVYPPRTLRQALTPGTSGNAAINVIIPDPNSPAEGNQTRAPRNARAGPASRRVRGFLSDLNPVVYGDLHFELFLPVGQRPAVQSKNTGSVNSRSQGFSRGLSLRAVGNKVSSCLPELRPE